MTDLLVRLLEDTPVALALIGGQATNHWARPRYTDDFDFTVAADPAGIQLLIDRLLGEGFRIVREQEGGSPSGPDFVRLERGATHDAVDLIAAKTDFQAGLIARATGDDGSPSLPVATPEDLIVLKLIANRSIDWTDIYRLVEARPELDWTYIEHWAGVWEVGESLALLQQELATRRPGLP